MIRSLFVEARLWQSFCSFNALREGPSILGMRACSMISLLSREMQRTDW